MPQSDNLLIPDHLFELTVKTLVGGEKVDEKGGASFGVWIHTAAENGYVWSYTPEKKWVIGSISSIDQGVLLTDLAHITTFGKEARTFPSTEFMCMESLNPKDTIKNHGVIPTYSEEEFHNIKIRFNTRNKIIAVPEQYYTNNQQIHRPNQNYRIEIFMIPNSFNRDRFLLVDKINLIDLTQNERTKIAVSGVTPSKVQIPFKSWCSSLTVDLTPEELRTILIQYRGMAGDIDSRSKLNSRDAAITASIMEVSGGSRLNYREHPDWPSLSLIDNGGTLTKLNVVKRYSHIKTKN